MTPGTDRKMGILVGTIPSASSDSGNAPKTHSVGSVGDHNLGMFTITEIALKITNSVPPTHFISEVPDTAYVNL
jgi:hypothetical protein